MHDTRVVGGIRMTVTSALGVCTFVEEAIDKDARIYIAFANTNLINCANRQPGFASSLQQFHVFNDGVGVQLASLLTYGKRFPENLNGTDLIPRLLTSLGRKVSLYLLGADSEVVQAAAAGFNRIKNAQVCGFWDGYSCWHDMPRVLQCINEARPDILLIAMGNPRQEMWIAKYGPQLKVKVLVGVGALFDYISGHKQRAPGLFRRLRLEWLFRLLYEPRRLWRRYSVDLVLFSFFIVRYAVSIAVRYKPIVQERRGGA